jgi:hypothetical protein
MSKAVGANTSGLRAAGDELARSQLAEAESVPATLLGSEVIAMHAYSECSTHWSVQYRIEHRTDPPSEPSDTPTR